MLCKAWCGVYHQFNRYMLNQNLMALRLRSSTVIVIVVMLGATVYVTQALRSYSDEMTVRAQQEGLKQKAYREKWKQIFEQHCKKKEVASNVVIVERARLFPYRQPATFDRFDLIRYECDNGVSYWTKHEGVWPEAFVRDYQNKS